MHILLYNMHIIINYVRMILLIFHFYFPLPFWLSSPQPEASWPADLKRRRGFVVCGLSSEKKKYILYVRVL